jgi:secreted PhoX family phosphatase
VLSCEENYDEFADPELYAWPADPYGAKRWWGWVVEIDPFDPTSTPRKHTALGRFHHENVAIRVLADGTVVCYLGDDRANHCFYKFVADRRYTGDRASDLKILESGKLYVADVERGRWLLLEHGAQPAFQGAGDQASQWKTQGDLLADANAAAHAIGGSSLDRPEDCEIHPRTGHVYLALTNTPERNPRNDHGRIVRLIEEKDDPRALAFRWELFAEGGPDAGFSCPDNLLFDDRGDLWCACDISSKKLGKAPYAPFQNNGLFLLRTSGKDAGLAWQFASGPRECELTGPCFSPDGSTLFLSVQHPGETSPSRAQATSRWPDGGDSVPRSAVVAIRGFPGA